MYAPLWEVKAGQLAVSSRGLLRGGAINFRSHVEGRKGPLNVP